MNNCRYLPHTLNTRYKAVLSYRQGNTIKNVCRRFKISSSSLMRWNKKFNGNINSLKDNSHRPKKTPKNSHTEREITNIKNLFRRNPKISTLELYYKLKKHGYKRAINSLYRIISKLNLRPDNIKKKLNISQSLMIHQLKLVKKCN